MALKTVRAWRGYVRAILKDCINDLLAVSAYDFKHPTYGLLTTTDKTNINNILSSFENKLLDTRLR